MMKLLVSLLMFSSITAFSSTRTCNDLKVAEEAILGLAYYGSPESDARKFCYFLSRAVAQNKTGLDGEVIFAIDYCAQGTESKLEVIAKEVGRARKAIRGCFANFGE
jgi:hypothetical protein